MCTKDSCDKTKGCLYESNKGLSCNDNNPCTTDSCNNSFNAGSSGGCQYAALTDGTACGNKRECSSGLCVPVPEG